MRPSDNIFDIISRIYYGKLNGTLSPDDLSNGIVLTAGIFANMVKNGSRTEEDIESFEALLPKLNQYFTYMHNLDETYKASMEGINMALYENENRFGRRL